MSLENTASSKWIRTNGNYAYKMKNWKRVFFQHFVNNTFLDSEFSSIHFLVFVCLYVRLSSVEDNHYHSLFNAYVRMAYVKIWHGISFLFVFC